MMMPTETRYSRWRTTAVIIWAIIGALILLGTTMWMLGRIASAFVPFLIAFIFVFLLNSPVTSLERRGMGRGIATALCLGAGLMVIAGVITFLVPAVSRQAVSFVDKAPEYLASADAMTKALQVRFSTLVVPAWVTAAVQSSSAQLSQMAVRVGNTLAGSLVNVGGGVATGLIDVLLALVIAFWALKDLPKLREEIVLLAGPRYGSNVEHLFATVTRIVGGYLKGQTIASFCTGLIAGVGLAILGVPYAIVLGLITFVFNYVPYVGPFAAGLIAALVALITTGPLAAVLAVAIVVVAQNVTDSLVTPRIMAEQVDLHPTLVIFSLLVGGTLFGIPGMLFAIPVAATMKGLFVYYYEKRTDRQITTEDGALFRTPACDSDDDSGSECEPIGDGVTAPADDAQEEQTE